MAEQACWVILLWKPPWVSELTHTKRGVRGRSLSWDLKEEVAPILNVNGWNIEK